MIHSVPNPVVKADVPKAGTTSELPRVALDFLEQLGRIPLGAWADAGRRLAELDAAEQRALAGTEHGPDTTARAVLRQLVNARPRVAAQARQRVLHLAAVARGFLHPSEVASMKKAALAAVLALVARPELGERRFAALYEPFAALIPLDGLPNAGFERAPASESTSTR